MTKSTIYWISASVAFFISMIMSLFTGGVFMILMLAAVLSGWTLWFMGLISRLRGD